MRIREPDPLDERYKDDNEEGYDDGYVAYLTDKQSYDDLIASTIVRDSKFLSCTSYVEDQEHLVYHDGTKHGFHQDWLVQDPPRDLEADVLAIIRHLEAYRRGELTDPDSGAHPLAHVRARCGIIMDVERGRNE